MRKVESHDAETVALQALAFLAADDERLEQFLALTGMAPDQLRAGLSESAGRAAILGAVLDHLLGWEALLLDFAAEAGLPPESIPRLRRHLPGAAPLD